MLIPVICECGHHFEGLEEEVGRISQCPVCGLDVVVPKPVPPDEILYIPGEFDPPKTSGKAIASLAIGGSSSSPAFPGFPPSFWVTRP